MQKIKNRLFSIVKHGYNYLEHGKNFVKENYLEAFVDKKGVPKKFFRDIP